MPTHLGPESPIDVLESPVGVEAPANALETAKTSFVPRLILPGTGQSKL